MQELFKALSILQTNQTVKKHFVHIQDKEVEVTLDEKKEIIRNGENNYVLKGGKPVKVEAKRIVRFKAGQDFSNKIN